MLSYAQNREDVLLNRLFPAGYVGFYIDVGANHPVNGSVTAHFYHARGWRGINVEPSGVFTSLERDRPRDVNLNLAVSCERGEATFHEFPEGTGVSTLDPQLARSAQDKFSFPCQSRTVTVDTLASICDRFAPARIDFLSIDVEGHERQVIQGGDWRRFRPRVVVAEATRPHGTEPCHQTWEPLLLEADYLFASFDGLNRYYVRAEDRDLAPLLATPVNVFDDYITFTEHQAVEESRRLKLRLETQESMGALTLAISRRLTRLELRFPAAARAIHRRFQRKPTAASAIEALD